jgi:gas vesicle protein
MSPKKDNTLALIGGAVLGAAAMYLLDPESGERRRREVAERTGDAAGRAGDAVAPLWERVADTAKSFGSSVATGAGAFGHNFLEKLEEARDSGRRSASHLADHASEFGEAVADKMRDAGKHARRAAHKPIDWFRPEPEPSHAGAYAAGGVGALLIGAAAMYLLDPQRGRARRARVVEQATSVVNRTGRTCSAVGRDLRNRATGAAHRARSLVETEDAVSAEQLLQRIRSEMGHVVSHAAAIQVMTDNHGRVTLHGKVLASEADTLLATVKGVGGVNEVINLLSVKETEQQMQDADTATMAAGGVPRM